MFAFIIQLADWIKFGVPSVFVLYFIYSWLHWIIRVVPGLFYLSEDKIYETKIKSSVIIPVVDEDPLLFDKVLVSIVAQKPNEIIVIINGPRNEELEKICKKNNVRFTWIAKSGKRIALDTGIMLSSNPILVLVDSDSIWGNNTLKILLKEFDNAWLGGVTTKQRIQNNNSIIGWHADVTERIRNAFTFKSMSVFGQIGCLPGRTFAIRKNIYLNYRDKFLHEKFFGVYKEYSDDRTLTNYILQAGYQTKFASKAEVFTFAPKTWKKYYQQQLRWARGSQYNNLRMLTFYFKETPYLGYMFFMDMLLPVMYASVTINFIINIINENTELLSVFDYSNVSLLIMLTITGALINTGLRLFFCYGENYRLV